MDLRALYEEAADAYLNNPASGWTPLNGFDPVDRVVLTLPPLADYGFIAIQFMQPNFGPNLATCATSALVLAYARHFRDRHPRGNNAHRLDMIQADLPAAGMTMMQMCRRLQRLSMLHFPIYEYTGLQNGLPSFGLRFGKPRDDREAIVFIPAQPGVPGWAFPHWTYGTVFHVEDAPLDMRPDWSAVVYTQFPLFPSSGDVFWRAETKPENQMEFDVMRVMGRACDCAWTKVCEHERAFVYSQHRYDGTLKRGVRRITLDGQRAIENTYHGVVDAICGTECRASRGADGSLVVKTYRGTSIVRPNMYQSTAIRMRGVLSWLKNFSRNNSYVPIDDRGVWDISPYRIHVYDITDFQAIDDWTVKTVAGRVVNSMLTTDPTSWVTEIEVERPTMAWAADQDLTLRLPRRHELLQRLATREFLDKATILDVVRRMAAEEGWDVDVSREELQVWLERTVTDVGKTTILPGLAGNVCWNCLQRVKTRRHICRACRERNRRIPPQPPVLTDCMITHVGFWPIWSSDYVLPEFGLKDDFGMRNIRTREVLIQPSTLKGLETKKRMAWDESVDEAKRLIERFRKHRSPRTQRGQLCGPMFLNRVPTCFPKGMATAIDAFLVRLAARRTHKASSRFYGLIFNWLVSRCGIEVLEPESWEYFISRYSGAKRVKNEEARIEENHGWAKKAGTRVTDYWDPINMTCVFVMVCCGMTIFPKSEKGHVTTLSMDKYLIWKKETKPRSICSPNPLVLQRLGRYTHPQTKWLARKFNSQCRLFYAGCSTPEDLNQWLNLTLKECPEPWSVVDDIVAIDSAHSQESFQFHRNVRQRQFPHMEQWIADAYTGIEHILARIGDWILSVSYVNASGVPDTSYKNSLPCLIIRLFAVAEAMRDTSGMTIDERLRWVDRVSREIWTAAAGDDGLTRMADYIDGIDVRNFDMKRYRSVWAAAGFDVKVQLIPPNRWRLATFLAMRPVWAGARYEWAPEPARRMKSMFWQFECPLHHESWVRGIATQVLQQGKAVPVLSDVCQWVLDNTTGPIAKVAASNEYSPFHLSEMSGGVNPRSVAEFCLDYHVTVSDYEEFRHILATNHDILVNFDCHVLRRVFLEES